MESQIHMKKYFHYDDDNKEEGTNIISIIRDKQNIEMNDMIDKMIFECKYERD